MMLLQRRSFARSVTVTTPLTMTELHLAYGGVVLRYLSSRLPRLADAEDVTVEVFVSAFRAFAKCPKKTTDSDLDPVRAWLLTIARNKAIDFVRKNAKRQQDTAALELLENSKTLTVGSAESLVLVKERQRQVRQIVAALPDDQREVLLLKYVDDLSLKEIGTILKKRPEAISSLLQRARASAREKGNAYFSEY